MLLASAGLVIGLIPSFRRLDSDAEAVCLIRASREGCLVDALNGGIQHGVELCIGLLG